MSLSQALNIASSGLRAAQAGLAIVSSNVANADTPGYVRKSLVQSTTGVGSFGSSVTVSGVNRELDQYVQRQLRIETAGGAYADLRAQFYERLQGVYGEPGSSTAVETVFNNFITSLQSLSTSPDSISARAAALNAAQVLAQQLNSMSADIQGLRADAENGLAEAAANTNNLLETIARLNQQLAGQNAQDPAMASLMDQRDHAIDELSELVDIKVINTDGNQVTVFTNSGVQLVGLKAARLSFDPQGTMTAAAHWSADPAERTVGTLMLVSPTGDNIDLLASKSIRSGTIAALVEMRDQTLVAAQAQLDAFAASMSQALSDRTVSGTTASVGTQNGFDLDLTGLQAGNSVRVSYTDVLSGTQKSMTFVRVDDPGALPLDPGPDPNNPIVGISFSGGPASVATQVATALGANFTVSNPSGSTLRILDDGGVAVAVTAATTTKTATGFASGSAELPLFVDGSGLYTGAYTSSGRQITGLAGRIAVNAAVLSDPTKLVGYGPSTPAGDATRPTFLFDQLTKANLTFQMPTQGGTSSLQATLPNFLRQVLVQQGQDAAAAASLNEGQQVVVQSLQQRVSASSGVNVDEEMANLLRLQSAYSANARVLSAVKEMLEILSRL